MDSERTKSLSPEAGGHDVGRQKVVLAGDLDAVAGVEHDRRVARLERRGEVGDRAVHLAPGNVGGLEDAVALRLERAGDGVRVRPRPSRARGTLA